MNLSSISNSVISLHRGLRTVSGALIEETLEDSAFFTLMTLTEGWTTYEKVSELTGQPVQWVLVQADKLTLEQAQQISAFQFEGRRYEVQPNESQQSGAPNYWRFACQPMQRVE